MSSKAQVNKRACQAEAVDLLVVVVGEFSLSGAGSGAVGSAAEGAGAERTLGSLPVVAAQRCEK
jgi:hypothetical protein